MPKIFQYLGYIIRFYTNDHLPIHVHIEYRGKEVKVEFSIKDELVILLFKKVRGKNPLTEAEAKEVAASIILNLSPIECQKKYKSSTALT